MDAIDKAFIDAIHKAQFEIIKPIKVENGKIYFHWSSHKIYSLFLDEVDEIKNYWFFGWHKQYRISIYTFINKSVCLG